MPTLILAALAAALHADPHDLIARLGSPCYRVREGASLLLGLRPDAGPLLRAAAYESEDAEVRDRAGRCLRTIADREARGRRAWAARTLDREFPRPPFLDSIWYRHAESGLYYSPSNALERYLYRRFAPLLCTDEFTALNLASHEGDFYRGYRAATRRMAVELLVEGWSVGAVTLLLKYMEVNDYLFLSRSNREAFAAPWVLTAAAYFRENPLP